MVTKREFILSQAEQRKERVLEAAELIIDDLRIAVRRKDPGAVRRCLSSSMVSDIIRHVCEYSVMRDTAESIED